MPQNDQDVEQQGEAEEGGMTLQEGTVVQEQKQTSPSEDLRRTPDAVGQTSMRLNQGDARSRCDRYLFRLLKRREEDYAPQVIPQHYSRDGSALTTTFLTVDVGEVHLLPARFAGRPDLAQK